MQSKKNTFLVVGTTIFVISSLFFVFWLSTRHSGSKPDIQVPTLSQSEQSAPPTLALLNDPDVFLTFELTPETLSSVLSQLQTPSAYWLTLVSSIYSEDTHTDTSVSVYHRDGLTRISFAAQQQEYLLTDVSAYAWSAHSQVVQTLPIGSFSSERTAKMPDIQMLIDSSPAKIQTVAFEEYNGLWVIVVDSVSDNGFVERNYVSIDSGLILKNEVYARETLILEMTVSSIHFESPAPALFVLPDGTILQ